jgi:membrane associated rhomboid family serine protease
MFPLKDDLQSRTFPISTASLIAVNLAVFLYQVLLHLGASQVDPRVSEEFVSEFGLVPCRLVRACGSPTEFPPPMLTVLSSMFLHGGLLHIAGNMLYLWIFGNNVEDTMGHGRFLVFYLMAGAVAALTQIASHPESPIPIVGASGAVAGVLGAYLLLFPRATILTLLVIGFFIRLVHMPALVVLGFWFVMQFLSGFLAKSLTQMSDGVAWFAHIGGFLSGMVLLILLRPRRLARL